MTTTSNTSTDTYPQAGGLADDRLTVICAVLRACTQELRNTGSGPADDLAHAIDDLLDGWQGAQP